MPRDSSHFVLNSVVQTELYSYLNDKYSSLKVIRYDNCSKHYVPGGDAVVDSRNTRMTCSIFEIVLFERSVMSNVHSVSFCLNNRGSK